MKMNVANPDELPSLEYFHKGPYTIYGIQKDELILKHRQKKSGNAVLQKEF
jgi:hypothetical protein